MLLGLEGRGKTRVLGEKPPIYRQYLATASERIQTRNPVLEEWFNVGTSLNENNLKTSLSWMRTTGFNSFTMKFNIILF